MKQVIFAILLSGLVSCVASPGSVTNMSAGDPIERAMQVVSSDGASHWSSEVIAGLSQFEQYQLADTLEWKTISVEEQGAFESDSEYQSRISANVDHTKQYVVAVDEVSSVVPSPERLSSYVLFTVAPYDNYEISSKSEFSTYEGSNSFGATTTVTSEFIQKVAIIPNGSFLDLDWTAPMAFSSSSMPSSSHESIPLYREALRERDADVVLVRVLSIEPNNPETYDVGYSKTDATMSLPYEEEVITQIIRADLDYAGLYDRNNEEFLGVFSDDFSRFFLLNESVEVDLTSIDARMPYDWKQ